MDVTFSNNLTWKTHICSAIKIARVNINVLLWLFYSKDKHYFPAVIDAFSAKSIPQVL